jgi:hypothetical protein
MKVKQSFRDEVDELSRRFVENYRRGEAGRTAIAAELQRYIDSHYEITGLNTTTAESDGKIGYALLVLHSPSGDSHVMLALRRDSRGRWQICAEAIIDSAAMHSVATSGLER